MRFAAIALRCAPAMVACLLLAAPPARAESADTAPAAAGSGQGDPISDLKRLGNRFGDWLKELTGSAEQAPAIGSASSPERRWQAAVERADQRISRFEKTLQYGSKIEIRDAGLALQSDPIAVARLNQGNADGVKARLNEVLGGVQESTKAKVRQEVARKFNVHPEDVTFFEATNPSSAIKVGQDWDVTVRVHGKDVAVADVREIVHDAYYEAATGRRAGRRLPGEPNNADRFAHRQAVEVINSRGVEAYGGANTEGAEIITGDKGQRLRDSSQISNAIEVKSNLPRDRALQAEEDAAALESEARRLTEKAAKAERAGDADGARLARREAAGKLQLAEQHLLDAQGHWLEQMRQFGKQYGRQIQPRVEAAGGKVPDFIQHAARILEQVERGELNPWEARTRLKDMGETPESLIRKSAALVEEAQQLRAPAAKGPMTGDVVGHNVQERMELERMKRGEYGPWQSDQQAKPNAPEQTPGKAGNAPREAGAVKEVPAARNGTPAAASTPGKAFKAGAEAAGHAGMALAVLDIYINYQACADEGKRKAECDKELALAASGIATLTGAGAVAFQTMGALTAEGAVAAETLAALGITSGTVSAVGVGLAAAGLPLAVYGVYHGGKRWADAPATAAEERLRQQQKELLIGFQRMVHKVRQDFGKLEALRTATLASCGQIEAQAQTIMSLDQDSRTRMARLQAWAPAVKRATAQCDEAHEIATAIADLALKGQQAEAEAIGKLDAANAAARSCKSRADADRIRELYRESRDLATRLQTDAGIARGRNNRLQAIRTEIGSLRGNLPALEEHRDALRANHARMRELAAAALAGRDKMQAANAQYTADRAALAKYIERLAFLLPNQAPSPAYRQEFDEARFNLNAFRSRLAETPETSLCRFGDPDPGAALRMALGAENLYGGGADLHAAAHDAVAHCGRIAASAADLDALESAANWVLSALDLNEPLLRKADSCQGASASAAPANCPANAVPVWNAEKQKNVCQCEKGYKVNDARNGCMPDKAAEPLVVACDTTTRSGGNPPQTVVVNVGWAAGTAEFSYDMESVPDRMVIQYGGQTIAYTGCVSRTGRIPLPLSGASDRVTISVHPSCRQASESTKWHLTFGCPGKAAQKEPLAAGLLLLEMLSGDVSFYLNDPAQARPLRRGDDLRSGASVVTGRGSHLALKTPQNTAVTVAENSHVTIGPAQGGKQAFELRRGSVDVSRRSDLPGYDDVIVTTGEGTVQSPHTRYRVERDERGTQVQVYEGRVRLTGSHLLRLYDYNVDRPKSAPARELELTAGEKALMLRTGTQASAAAPTPAPRPQRPATEAGTGARHGNADDLYAPPAWMNDLAAAYQGRRRADDLAAPAPARASPPPSGRINVHSAVYGPNCRTPSNVTAHLAGACGQGGGQRCDYRIDHRAIGDPAVGCYKDYVYRWSCAGSGDGRVHEGIVRGEASGKIAVLSCPPPAGTAGAASDRGVSGGRK
ncbi:MAG TPA: FecR domain-containing protein [Paucimonas sp.]|nr:FecR domain-containing protein [Paucimonas sp.]